MFSYRLDRLQIVSNFQNISMLIMSMAHCKRSTMIDQIVVLCLTQHKMGHFRDILPSQSLGLVL